MRKSRLLAPWIACAALGIAVWAAPSDAHASGRSLVASAQASTTPAASAGSEVVLHSLSLIGVRYRRGGSSPATGLDCSGLVRHVYREALGFVLPRRSEEMSREGTPVPVDALQPGDLVFFNTLRRKYSHVGIYIGENRFVHAPSSGGRVRVESIGARYWARRFNGARRVADESVPAPAHWLQVRDASGESSESSGGPHAPPSAFASLLAPSALADPGDAALHTAGSWSPPASHRDTMYAY